MSSEWASHLLGELATFKYGKFLAKSDLAPSGFPVFSGYGIVGYLPTYQFERSQLLIVCRGEGGTGDVKMSPPKCSITNLAIVLSADETKVAKGFLYWTLKASDTHRLRTGSAQAQIVIGSLEKFRLTIPRGLGEQLRIAAILDALDDRIALLRETNATLEAIAQALFKSWFVDFDPVRAKSQGLAPAGMDEATAALFPAGFEESALGLVPKGWRATAFTDTVTVIGGGTPKTSNPEYWGGDIPWFSVVDAPSGADVFVVSTEKSITATGLQNCSAKLLPIGTTIISARGTVGRLAVVGRAMAMNQSCYALRGKAGDAYFTHFTTRGLIESLKQRSHGSVFDTITRETLASVSVVYPHVELLGCFEAAVEPVMARIRQNLTQRQTLATLRDTLLPRLISGQLRVPQAEALAT